MQFADYQALIAEGVLVGLDASLRIKNHGGLCCVNGFIAKPLTSVSPQYPRGAEIDIAIGSGIGTTFLLTIKGSPFLYSQASDLWAAAYLYEQTADGARQDNGDYQFIRDYVVVHELVVNRYERQLQKGSAVWGAFTHPSEQAAPLALYAGKNHIQARPYIELPTPEHQQAALRSVVQSSALDRFLNLYHLLELSFDYDLVQHIRRLGNDLKGVGKLLNSYNQSEFERLHKLIQRYCTDINFLSNLLDQVFSMVQHRTSLEEMLFDYSKESNPYKEKRAAFMLAATTGFSQAIFSTNKLDWTPEKITRLVSYVIYRFRCSIAHASIGEFIIGNADESFVAEVAEPLIGSILAKVYFHDPT